MKIGWKSLALGEIAQVSAGNSAPQDKELFENGIHPFFRTADAGKVKFGDIHKSADYLNDRGVEKLRRYPKGTILFPKSGASTFLNHRVILAVEGYVSSHLATIVADEKLAHPRFLLYYLFTVQSQDLVQDHAYPSLNLPIIAGIYVDLPPLDEQKRIVQILDSTFASIDKAIENTEKNLANARELFVSVLTNTIDGYSKDTDVFDLQELCEVKDGTHDSPKYVETGVPFVTQKNIRDSGLCFEDTKYISQEDHESFYKRSNVAQGDILISMIGVNRGMACLVDDSRTFSIKNVGLIKSNDNVNMEYLLYFIKHRNSQAYIDAESRGGAQPFIGLGKLRKFPTLLPPLENQNLAVEAINRAETMANRLTHVYAKRLESLKELKQSILQKAFTGQLTADFNKDEQVA